MLFLCLYVCSTWTVICFLSKHINWIAIALSVVDFHSTLLCHGTSSNSLSRFLDVYIFACSMCSCTVSSSSLCLVFGLFHFVASKKRRCYHLNRIAWHEIKIKFACTILMLMDADNHFWFDCIVLCCVLYCVAGRLCEFSSVRFFCTSLYF